MSAVPASSPVPPGLLSKSDFPALLVALQAEGYRIKGPVLRAGTIGWGDISRVEDLPIGWQDYQEPGRYRLEHTPSNRLFDVLHGPDSLKRETFAPEETLLVIERKQKGFSTKPVLPSSERTAMLGVRACDLAGLKIQDRIFLNDCFPDPYYKVRRDNLFLIAVHCTRTLETCFCASMGTGPKAQTGFDLVLTESNEDMVVQSGSPQGNTIMAALPLSPVSEHRLNEDEARFLACAAQQTRRIDSSGLPETLYELHDSHQWETVAERCLACTNCTMVCPTCFCHTVEDNTDLSFTTTTRVRKWDSCFTQDHGCIHGKNFRPTIKDRYRMWLTHKLASWIDQFGTSGCVGCGRCLTWCPVGIDLTQEMQKLFDSIEQKNSHDPSTP